MIILKAVVQFLWLFMEVFMWDTNWFDEISCFDAAGFWKVKYNVNNSLIENLAPRLTKQVCVNFASIIHFRYYSQGYVVCEVEYRRVSNVETSNGKPVGGWPLAHIDILLALAKLEDLVLDGSLQVRLDLSRSIFMGHSAGFSLFHIDRNSQ